MKNLSTIVKELSELKIDKARLAQDWAKENKRIEGEILELIRLETLALADVSIDKIQVAESILYVRGNPYAMTDDTRKREDTIAELSIVDIATGCRHLKHEFFGNKRYGGFYQRTDCKYGYGPRHGGIVDEVGLRNQYQKIDLTDDQKDACIYYLKNWTKIASLTAKPV